MERDEKATSPRFVKIRIEQEGEEKWILAENLQKITGAKFVSQLQMQNRQIEILINQAGKKLREAGFFDWLWNFWGMPPKKIPIQQLFRGSYYQKEMEKSLFPDVVLRFISQEIGWGVFAARDFKKGSYIAEYTGILRKRQKSDRTNAYCFEYVVIPDAPTQFVIDAREQGGISRYINHSVNGNLEPTLATIGYLTHVLLLAKRTIQKGEQLTYDYGPDYWAHRLAPQRI